MEDVRSFQVLVLVLLVQFINQKPKLVFEPKYLFLVMYCARTFTVHLIARTMTTKCHCFSNGDIVRKFLLFYLFRG